MRYVVTCPACDCLFPSAGRKPGGRADCPACGARAATTGREPSWPDSPGRPPGPGPAGWAVAYLVLGLASATLGAVAVKVLVVDRPPVSR